VFIDHFISEFDELVVLNSFFHITQKTDAPNILTWPFS
jgi:hypothetical protein